MDSDGEVAAFCDSTDRWLPLVCTMNVTVATEQARKLFSDAQQLLAQIVEKRLLKARGVARVLDLPARVRAGARRQDGRIIASPTIRRDQPWPAIAKRPSACLMALNAW